MLIYKKGFTITEIAAIIAAIVVIGVVAYITLRSAGISFTGISESIKKFAGLDTKKAEASTKDTEGCTIKRYYWSKTTVKVGESAIIFIEGNGNCDGKAIAINTFKDISFWPDSNYLSLNPQFKDTKAEISFPTKEKGKFYFTLKFGDYTSPESERLQIG